MTSSDGAASDAPRSTRRLDRELIVRAALGYIDNHGAQGLTMRALGQELDAAPMALYRHVSGREDLLEAVVELLLRDLRGSMDAELTGSGWQAYLQAFAHAVRRVATEHPAAFPLVATRHPAAPWLRPPLRSLDLVEDFLAMLRQYGLSDQQTVEAYRAFSSFLLGQLLLETATRGAGTSPVEVPLDEGDAQIPQRDGQLDLRGRPETARLQPLLSEDRGDEEFEKGLETLLDRLEMTISQ
jgi:TetR/AcrR family transcriptional regulator, tetracycline repressor protein